MVTIIKGQKKKTNKQSAQSECIQTEQHTAQPVNIHHATDMCDALLLGCMMLVILDTLSACRLFT